MAGLDSNHLIIKSRFLAGLHLGNAACLDLNSNSSHFLEFCKIQIVNDLRMAFNNQIKPLNFLQVFASSHSVNIFWTNAPLHGPKLFLRLLIGDLEIYQIFSSIASGNLQNKFNMPLDLEYPLIIFKMLEKCRVSRR